jgi:hypothetical protein
MDTLIAVNIFCNKSELINAEPFIKAAEFSEYDADIMIACRDTGQQKLFHCSSIAANCTGWRHFRSEWIRQFGPP